MDYEKRFFDTVQEMVRTSLASVATEGNYEDNISWRAAASGLYNGLFVEMVNADFKEREKLWMDMIQQVINICFKLENRVSSYDRSFLRTYDILLMEVQSYGCDLNEYKLKIIDCIEKLLIKKHKAEGIFNKA